MGRRKKKDKNELAPLEVEVYDNNVVKAYRILKRQMGYEGMIWEERRRRHYIKPSQERREKSERAEKRRRKDKRRSKEKNNY